MRSKIYAAGAHVWATSRGMPGALRRAGDNQSKRNAHPRAGKTQLLGALLPAQHDDPQEQGRDGRADNANH